MRSFCFIYATYLSYTSTQDVKNLGVISKLCDVNITKLIKLRKNCAGENLKAKGTPEGIPLSTGFRARGFRQFFDILGIIIFLRFLDFWQVWHG